MNFKNAREVEQIVWEMRLADWPRAVNRQRINDLANGVPPYSPEEERENNISVNVNPLSATNVVHDARRQFYSAFLKPGKFFSATLHGGPVHKQAEYSTTVTALVNRIMKRSKTYFETYRSKFALDVLHGIGPAVWQNREKWCPDAIGVEDVLIPANTLISMENVPMFAIYRNWTGMQLRKMTSRPNRDPAWNMDLVDYMIEWVDKQGQILMGTTWPEVWSPEKMGERIKGDGGLYASDALPTIDVYDFYFWNDEGKNSGWNRRIVLDQYGAPGVGGVVPDSGRGSTRYDDAGDLTSKFLYNPGRRKYASKMEEIISFQFADLSAVAPFRYHSVRSLGFLIWAVSHLQNRLYCATMNATFESLMQYFRVKSQADIEHVLKVDLINRGFLDESLQFIPQAERWQTNLALAEFAYGRNEQILAQNASSYVQKQDYSEGRERKTKFQVMAEVNSTTALVSAGLLQAYKYQTFEDIEIFRRFMRPNSSDPDVREFRLGCLKAGVPEKYLSPEMWEIQNEQLMGGGNKTMEMAVAEQLLQMRNLYDPEPQRKILRNVTLAITDNAALAEEWVPDKPNKITDSVHDAQQSVASIMMGQAVSPRTGQNHIETAEAWLHALATMINQFQGGQGMAPPDKIMGMQNLAKHIAEQIQLIAQDPEEKQRVKKYGDDLGKMMNLVKAMAQRTQAAMQKQAQNGNGGMDPKDKAKIAGMMAMAQAKQQTTLQSHGARTAQKQVQFEQQQRHDRERAQQELAKKAAETELELAGEAAKNRLRAYEE